MRYDDILDTDEKLDAVLKEQLTSDDIPESLLPEQMTARLHQEKRSGIRISKKTEIRAIAALCACMMLVVGVSAAMQRDGEDPMVAEKCFMEDAGSYHDLYQQVMHLAKESEYIRTHNRYDYTGGFRGLFGAKQENSIDDAMPVVTSPAGAFENFNGAMDGDMMTDGAVAEDTVTSAESTSNGMVHKYSDTLSQVEGIAEADCVKTDGEAIYYLVHEKLFYIEVEDGIFSEPVTVQPPALDEAFPNGGYSARELYLVDGNAIVIYNCVSYTAEAKTAVVTYAPDAGTGIPTQKNVLYQDGSVTATRVLDGTMYLVTSTAKNLRTNIKEDDLSAYVPCCGADSESYVAADDIMIPDDWGEHLHQLAYTVLGAIDLSKGEVKASTAFAGTTAHIYMSRRSLYLASYMNDTTRITRISYLNDEIVPIGVGEVTGNLLNQYAMYEKGEAFFVASNGRGKSNGRQTNYLTSFDLSMTQLDTVDFAEGEQLKAVNYTDDRAYVVTFYQTDPLFSIDISTPSDLRIDDGYKVSGYSTFLYPWNGHLLSFGVESGDFGNGLKLMMYDTTADGKMVMLDNYIWVDPTGMSAIYSPAVADYKALYLDAENNLIGVPVWRNDYAQQDTAWGYEFFRFSEELGCFERLAVTRFTNKDWQPATRCISIDSCLYLLTPSNLMSVDMTNFTVMERLALSDSENIPQDYGYMTTTN